MCLVGACLIAGLSVSCGKTKPSEAATTGSIQEQLQKIMNQPGKPEIEAEADSEFVESIGSYDYLDSLVENTPGKLLVFDMYADWCVPCRVLAPTYDTLAKTHAANAVFYRVDVQRHQDIAEAFRVQSIPLVVFIKDKEVIHSISGLNPRDNYEKVIVNCGSSIPLSECTSRLKETL